MPIHGYPGNVITANPVAPTSTVATGVWTTEQQLLAISQGNWPGYQYPVERSLRFNSADSAYLNRTFGSPTAQNTWTISCWLKRGALSTQQTIFSAGTSNRLEIIFASNNTLQIADASTNFIVTTPVYRDPSSWYHIVIRANGSGSAMQVYVNNVVTTNSTTNNLTTSYWNASGTVGYIGSLGGFSSNYLNGYLTEINFIDGQALTPSSFGETDSNTGVWKPKAYSGTYGTNGFYLKFADNSGTTSTTLGKDSSGNGNNWTPNNFSVTAGAGNDSLVDTPTSYGTDTGVGGTVRGNYATLNPLNSSIVPTNGNLDRPTSALAPAPCYSTIGMTSGKWYFEYQITGVSTVVGVWGNGNAAMPTTSYPTYYWDIGAGSAAALNLEKTSGTASGTLGNLATNDIYGIALDIDNTTIYFYKNNSLVQTITGMTFVGPLFFVAGSWASGTSSTGNINFGQRAFAYTAPSGFKALCTQNLPPVTIGATSTTQANDYFNTVLYTGTGSSQSITGVGFQPDFIWIKDRSNARAHVLQNAIAGFSQYLQSNATDAETTASSGVTAVGSDGFTVGTQLAWNSNTETFVAWNWNAGGSNATNTSGTITSTVRANTTSGFSIVTYTGTGSNATVGHGLGVAPSMVIVKPRSTTGSWIVYATALGSANLYTVLNAVNDPYSAAPTVWNSTAPTSSVFSIGTASGVNTSTTTYVAYCFAPVAGYSAFGSYTGNGSTDGPFVYLGFRPAFVMVKVTSTTDDWIIEDNKRNTYNPEDAKLSPNLTSAEVTGSTYYVDFLSNGFKLRNTNGLYNTSSATYIYAAFAEAPFKFSLAR